MAIDLMGMDFNFSFIPYGETFIYKTIFVSLTAASCTLSRRQMVSRWHHMSISSR